MKKVFALIIALAFFVSLTGCESDYDKTARELEDAQHALEIQKGVVERAKDDYEKLQRELEIYKRNRELLGD